MHLACKGLLKFNLVSILAFSDYLSLLSCIFGPPPWFYFVYSFSDRLWLFYQILSWMFLSDLSWCVVPIYRIFKVEKSDFFMRTIIRAVLKLVKKVMRESKYIQGMQLSFCLRFRRNIRAFNVAWTILFQKGTSPCKKEGIRVWQKEGSFLIFAFESRKLH